MIPSQSIRNARACARRIVAGETAVWEVAMHMPTVRVRVDAASQEEARTISLTLSPEEYAEGLIRRLQRTRPEAGDIVGALRLSPERSERSRA